MYTFKPKNTAGKSYS